MTIEKAIEMIDEYLLEPNNINKEWVECLQLCKQALVDNVKQKAEIETLKTNNHSLCLTLQNRARVERAEAIKEFAERLKESCYAYSDVCGYKTTVIDIESIDNLVKDLTEDKE